MSTAAIPLVNTANASSNHAASIQRPLVTGADSRVTCAMQNEHSVAVSSNVNAISSVRICPIAKCRTEEASNAAAIVATRLPHIRRAKQYTSATSSHAASKV